MINRYIVCLGVLLFAFTSCVKDGGERLYEIIDYVDVGDSVPAFTVSDDEGNTFMSSAFEGKRSLLILFASTCPDCRKVLPQIDKYVWPYLKDNPDYLLITISREETASAVNNYWAEQGYTMPKYLDPKRDVFSLFANSTIPRLYVINETGQIEWKAIETLEISPEELLYKIIKQ
ncbi:peroxiredoxin [Parabacteroides sp. PF5-5]|uniref:TlpA family protein disulfide reductase n=1 Tax=unclassified Parabacteroides TaxID=2649774 RepID=UPI0024740527|nr:MULTISPECIES: TlpA disulfide reductase family protein [unclassified Parabacteroides]MDH6304728.1 peroxiredoxin [Parabacteroides sp. PH5-39]MDH6315657.1 peroxiredoxin [Parabacteroides sp. PF5-13]MDH6319318.1 peroxiredoxin [Parabacteroides sp. PH5-13]MDH6323049.1 peroxiredoxin [Parabacteroides sp. PH5-8]MDH6326850.1 peroxiredoxin [Parabacteroides sp. PH5-41]